MKSRIISIIIMLAVTFFILNFYYIQSVAIMLGYNYYNKNKSIAKEHKIEINISKPEGDWYPLMNYYVSEEFGKYVGEEVYLTILYSFPGFTNGSSAIYNSKSELYSSFYGCYIIKSNNFGFNENGRVNIDEIFKIPEFDFKYLVLGSMGIDPQKIKTVLKDVKITEKTGCTEIEFSIDTNGVYHEYKKGNSNYIQYGKPYSAFKNKDFQIITLFSKMHIVREDGYDLIYYIFSPSKIIVQNWNYYTDR